MHIPLDYNIVNERTPENIEPVYGGITFEYDAEEIPFVFYIIDLHDQTCF